MKDKILYLILGILIGAIITAGCFLIFTKNSQPNLPNDSEKPNFEEMDDMRKNGDENFEKGDKFKDDNSNDVTSENEVNENTTIE